MTLDEIEAQLENDHQTRLRTDPVYRLCMTGDVFQLGAAVADARAMIIRLERVGQSWPALTNLRRSDRRIEAELAKIEAKGYAPLAARDALVDEYRENASMYMNILYPHNPGDPSF